MSYTNSTPNYNLPQWIGTDKPTFLGDFNGAFSAIDTAMKDNADASSAATSTANAANATAVSANTNANTALNTANNAKNTADAATAAAASATSTANTAKTTADNAAHAALSNNVANLAPAYDNTLTYAVGDLVTYIDSNNTGKLYRCIIAVNEPGDFNVNYWDDITASVAFEPKTLSVKVGDYTTSNTLSDMMADVATVLSNHKNLISPKTKIWCMDTSGGATGNATIYNAEHISTQLNAYEFGMFSASGSNILFETIYIKPDSRAYDANITSGGTTFTNITNVNFSASRSYYVLF